MYNAWNYSISSTPTQSATFLKCDNVQYLLRHFHFQGFGMCFSLYFGIHYFGWSILRIVGWHNIVRSGIHTFVPIHCIRKGVKSAAYTEHLFMGLIVFILETTVKCIHALSRYTRFCILIAFHSVYVWVSALLCSLPADWLPFLAFVPLAFSFWQIHMSLSIHVAPGNHGELRRHEQQ